MSELPCIARLKIPRGKIEEFKRLATECSEPVRTRDTGTLEYEMYLNADATECMVFERYRDSQALLDPFSNMGETMAAIFQTCTGSGVICGTPTAELMERLRDAPIQVYRPFLPG